MEIEQSSKKIKRDLKFIHITYLNLMVLVDKKALWLILRCSEKGVKGFGLNGIAAQILVRY